MAYFQFQIKKGIRHAIVHTPGYRKILCFINSILKIQPFCLKKNVSAYRAHPFDYHNYFLLPNGRPHLGNKKVKNRLKHAKIVTVRQNILGYFPFFQKSIFEKRYVYKKSSCGTIYITFVLLNFNWLHHQIILMDWSLVAWAFSRFELAPIHCSSSRYRFSRFRNWKDYYTLK